MTGVLTSPSGGQLTTVEAPEYPGHPTAIKVCEDSVMGIANDINCNCQLTFRLYSLGVIEISCNQVHVKKIFLKDGRLVSITCLNDAVKI